MAEAIPPLRILLKYAILGEYIAVMSGGENVKKEELFNDLLVMLFNEIMDMEENVLITGSLKEISINDIHILDAIGIQEPKNMSTVAKAMSVTVGTLTTAINSLVKKGYVSRVRSADDKRVVLLSLSEKGVIAYKKHAAFHKRMVQAIMEGLDGEELEVLASALEKLRRYFKEL